MPDIPNDILLLLGRMDAKLDTALGLTADHEKRLKVLENARARQLGAAAAISTLAGSFGAYAVNHLMP
ncbi:hypothetical protein [Nitrospirillum iridis]|uniref:Muconolactone delta-isomerase n=1 Tax=Nitrospirillum iridis TaxID=765888 RepID=A0A7X0EDQ1_9PROT|nr:hypothetical protein [Nitrospirillum iridis]MBB6253032.1 muconolactone delta-isomerase [Nitrospirillum iridis]